MEAIHLQLRQRILRDCDAGMRTAEVASKFSVSVPFVNKLKRQRTRTGSIEPRPHGGGRTRALIDREADIRRLMDDANTYTMAELHAIPGVSCSAKTVWAEVRRLGYRFKKRP